MDVKAFYLNNQIGRAEYIMIHISMIPQEFLDIYNIIEKAHNKYISERVTKGMYELPEAGRVAHETLVKHI